MKLKELYKAVQTKLISFDKAVEIRGECTQDDKYQRILDLAQKPESFFSTLDLIESNEITRQNAAETLGISERGVNNQMRVWNIRRPASDLYLRKAEYELTVEIQRKLALDYIAQRASLKDIAEISHKDERSVRRWVSALLHDHADGMRWRDLHEQNDQSRARVAAEIARKIGLDAKFSYIDEIIRGKRDKKGRGSSPDCRKSQGSQRKTPPRGVPNRVKNSV